MKYLAAAQIALLTLALLLAALAVRAAWGWDERLAALEERTERMSTEPATTRRESMVDCPATGTTTKIVTYRQEGETPTQHAARHKAEVAAEIEVCAVQTGGGG